MKNEITHFTFAGVHKIRVVTINGEPWLVAKDVCDTLGITNTGNAYSRLSQDERISIHLPDANRGTPNKIAVSESGLYKLVMRSDKPEARAFQDWVTREVLPAIRKDGAYVMGEEKVRTGEVSEEEIIRTGYEALMRKCERITKERDEALHSLEEAQPKAEWYEEFGAAEGASKLPLGRSVAQEPTSPSAAPTVHLHRDNGGGSLGTPRGGRPGYGGKPLRAV